MMIKKGYFEQFINLRQGKLTIDEYSNQFRRLQEVCGLDENEEHDFISFLRRFETGYIEEYERLEDHS